MKVDPLKNNKIIQYLKWLWAVAVVIFIGYYFYQHLPEVLVYLKTMRFGMLILSIVLMMVSKFFSVEIARQSVSRDGWKPDYFQMFSIFTVTELGKYIPGSIWQFAARAGFYKENAFSNKKTAKAVLIESIWQAVGAFCFGFLLLAITPPLDLLNKWIDFSFPSWVWVVLPIFIIIIWFFGLLVLERIIPVEKRQSEFSRLIRLLLLQIGVWVTLGLSFFLVFGFTDYQNILQFIGGYAISWVAGYLFLFAPSGIGVREFVLVALFSTILPAEQIATFGIVHRVLYTLADALIGIAGFAMQKRYSRTNSLEPKENE